MSKNLIISLLLCLIVSEIVFSQEIIDTLPATMAVESFREKIDYSSPYDEDNKKIADLIWETMQHTTAIGLANGTYQMAGGVQIDIKPEEIEAEKISFYQEIRKKYPELKLPEYSRENYYQFLLLIPKISARIGLYCEVIFDPQISQGKITSSELYYYFSNIGSFCQKKVDGKKYDVVFLENTVTLGGEEILLPIMNNPSAGVSHYQTIFVEKDVIEDFILHKNITIDDQLFAEVKKMGTKGLWSMLGQASNPEEVAYASYMNFIIHIDNQPLTFEDMVDKIVCHESTHIENEFDEGYISYNKLDTFLDSDLYEKRSNQIFLNNESLAYLGEIIKEKRIDQSLYDLIFCWGNEDLNGHMTTMKNLFQYMIVKVRNNPSEYKCQVDKNSAIQPEWQICFQLAGLVDQPEVIKKLATNIREDVIKNNYTIKKINCKKKRHRNYFNIVVIFIILMASYYFFTSFFFKERNNKNKKKGK